MGPRNNDSIKMLNKKTQKTLRNIVYQKSTKRQVSRFKRDIDFCRHMLYSQLHCSFFVVFFEEIPMQFPKKRGFLTFPLQDWLDICPDGIHYRPITFNDIWINAKLWCVEIPLCTAVSGSASNIMTRVTIVKIRDYVGEVSYQESREKITTYQIADMLDPDISFTVIPVSTWRNHIKGLAFLKEKNADG